jgi:hypothetical protein
MDVAVAIGSDPATMYSAILPLPPDLDEMMIAGFLRGKPVEMVKCETSDLEVPANSEIVLEGYVDLGELRSEGPFGSFEEFARRTGLRSAALKRLSQADAFGSLKMNRQTTLWRSLPERGAPTPFDGDDLEEPPVPLPALTPLEEVLAEALLGRAVGEHTAIGFDHFLRIAKSLGGVKTIGHPLLPAVAGTGDENVAPVPRLVIGVERKITAQEKERRVAQDRFERGRVPAFAVGDREVSRNLRVVVGASGTGKNPGGEASCLAGRKRLPAVHLILVGVPRIFWRFDDQRIRSPAIAGQNGQPASRRIYQHLATVLPQARRVSGQAENIF